jgi:hypothetical protein
MTRPIPHPLPDRTPKRQVSFWWSRRKAIDGLGLVLGEYVYELHLRLLCKTEHGESATFFATRLDVTFRPGNNQDRRQAADLLRSQKRRLYDCARHQVADAARKHCEREEARMAAVRKSALAKLAQDEADALLALIVAASSPLNQTTPPTPTTPEPPARKSASPRP